MLFKNIKNSILKNLIITFLCSAIFLLISLPFSQLFPILKSTEIRPAAAFYPAFGLIFGFWGALGCAIGNLLLDIIQGIDAVVCIHSFFIQFIISYLTYVLWYGTYRIKNKDKRTDPPIFNKTSNILKYNILVLICSVFASVMVGSLLQISGYARLFGSTSLVVFFNHLVFGILIGMPMVALLTKIKQLNQMPMKKNIKKGNIFFSNFILLLTIIGHISIFLYTACFNNLPKELFYFCLASSLIFVFTKPMSAANTQKKSREFIFSLNEKMIFSFTMSGIVLTFVTGLVVYMVLLDTNISTVDLWEKICFAVVIVINLFFIATTITVRFVERKITVPISNISESVSLYDARDNSGSIPEIKKSCQDLLNEKNEIGEMATSIVNMLDDIENYTETIKKNTIEKERTAAQLEIAAKIQTDLLPHNFYDYSDMGINLYACMTPARVVGGDFYDFYSVNDDNIAFVIGDVSGKGIPAALFMSMSKMLIKMYISSDKKLEEAINKVNAYICQNNSMEMFLTAFVGIFNIKTNILTYVNAGHNYPMLLRNGSYSPLVTTNNFMLGVFDDAEYTSGTVTLNKNDSLFMYTDGLTEAKSSSGKMFGERRLIEALNNCIDYSVEKTLSTLENSVNEFFRGTAQFDDITMLCFRICDKNSLTVNADTTKLHTVLKFVEQFIKNKPVNVMSTKNLKIAVEEIFVNICHYAYGNKKGNVEISVDNSVNNSITITFKDCGKPFNPLEQPDPNLEGDIMDMNVGGLGIYMVKEICDNIIYEYTDNKNILTISKSFETNGKFANNTNAH